MNNIQEYKYKSPVLNFLWRYFGGGKTQYQIKIVKEALAQALKGDLSGSGLTDDGKYTNLRFDKKVGFFKKNTPYHFIRDGNRGRFYYYQEMTLTAGDLYNLIKEGKLWIKPLGVDDTVPFQKVQMTGDEQENITSL